MSLQNEAYRLGSDPRLPGDSEVILAESLKTRSNGNLDARVIADRTTPADQIFEEIRPRGVEAVRVYFSRPIRQGDADQAEISVVGNGANGEIDLSGVRTEVDVDPSGMNATLTFDPPLTEAGKYALFLDSLRDERGRPVEGLVEIPFDVFIGDVNRTGRITVDTLFVFLNHWFAQETSADFNYDEQITIDDLFQFLNLFFASNGIDLRAILRPGR